jgi:gas vesicle protein
MNAKSSLLVTAATAFVGGFFAGLFYASETGHTVRRRIADQAQHSTRWMEARLHEVETRVHVMEEHLEEAGHEISDKLREATGRYVPRAEEDWTVQQGEMTRDLRRMPRR